MLLQESKKGIGPNENSHCFLSSRTQVRIPPSSRNERPARFQLKKSRNLSGKRTATDVIITSERGNERGDGEEGEKKGGWEFQATAI